MSLPATASGCSNGRMAASQVISARQSSHFLQLMEDAAREVFTMMMAASCIPVVEYPEPQGETLSAVIGLAGEISACFVLTADVQCATAIAEKLTGLPSAELDETVRDAMGEVCNMIAGSWKENAALGCNLSTPTIVTGTGYHLYSQRATTSMSRSFRFDDRHFRLSLSIDIPA